MRVKCNPSMSAGLGRAGIRQRSALAMARMAARGSFDAKTPGSEPISHDDLPALRDSRLRRWPSKGSLGPQALFRILSENTGRMFTVLLKLFGAACIVASHLCQGLKLFSNRRVVMSQLVLGCIAIVDCLCPARCLLLGRLDISQRGTNLRIR